MRILYGRSEPFYVPLGMPRMEVNLRVSTICEQPEPGNYMEGYVRCREYGRPIQNARLVFITAGFRATIHTDENGYYKLLFEGDRRPITCFVYARGFYKEQLLACPLQNKRMDIVLGRKHRIFI